VNRGEVILHVAKLPPGARPVDAKRVPQQGESPMPPEASAGAVPATVHWLSGGGEMGQLVRAMDWATTPLGPIESWPQSLRTTVSLCLASNFPISIAWGPQRVQIYNDGYWPICGGKYPVQSKNPHAPFHQC
jgi:hypothetical protein